jgi:hypothetical protein
MTREMWLGLARHVLTIIGGGFVAKGYVDASTADTIIGASIALGGAAWSVADKRN